MTFAHRALAVVWKDLLAERRSKESLNALLFFSLLLLFIFQFTLGPDRERLVGVLPGLLWLGFVLSGLLALGRSFQVEHDNDCWEALVLAPGDKSAIYAGKAAAALTVMLVVEGVVLAVFGLFFNVDVAHVLPALALVVVLGTVGLAAVGTLVAAMAVNVRSREVLFPVLFIPIVVPVLLGTVRATEAVFAGEPLARVGHWLGLVAAADALYLAVGLLTFEFLLEG